MGFMDIGSNLHKDIVQPKFPYFNILDPSTLNSIFIEEVASSEISLLFFIMQMNKICRPFSFPNIILQDNW